MNTNAELTPSASHDYNTLLAAGADTHVSTSENVSAERNNELVNADPLSISQRKDLQLAHDRFIRAKVFSSIIYPF
jgi:hypothetical protein